MLAVIFRAEVANADQAYADMAERMRVRAIESFGCREFIAYGEGDQELAISYWDSAEQIQAWRQDSEHLVAQRLGRERWYRSYHIQVVEVLREYRKPAVAEIPSVE